MLMFLYMFMLRLMFVLMLMLILMFVYVYVNVNVNPNANINIHVHLHVNVNLNVIIPAGYLHFLSMFALFFSVIHTCYSEKMNGLQFVPPKKWMTYYSPTSNSLYFSNLWGTPTHQSCLEIWLFFTIPGPCQGRLSL